MQQRTKYYIIQIKPTKCRQQCKQRPGSVYLSGPDPFNLLRVQILEFISEQEAYKLDIYTNIRDKQT